VSRYQKGKTDLDFTEARDSEWQWQPGYILNVKKMFSKSTYWCNNIYILKMDYTQARAFNGPLTGLSR